MTFQQYREFRRFLIAECFARNIFALYFVKETVRHSEIGFGVRQAYKEHFS